MIAETKTRANQIFLKLGKEDGKKHIDQIIYFCEYLNSSELLTYWTLVQNEFTNAINNNTSNKEIRSGFPC
jgi:hypothetical protein